MGHKGSSERPPTGWEDDLIKIAGSRWSEPHSTAPHKARRSENLWGRYIISSGVGTPNDCSDDDNDETIDLVSK